MSEREWEARVGEGVGVSEVEEQEVGQTKGESQQRKIGYQII